MTTIKLATRRPKARLRGRMPARQRGAPSRRGRWLLGNLRAGRMQKTLGAAVALSAPPLAFEIYLEHYKGSFGDKWMWTPIVLTPPLTAAGVAAIFSERVARTALPALSALYLADGLIGVWTHVQGVRKKPGGFGEPDLQPGHGAAAVGARIAGVGGRVWPARTADGTGAVAAMGEAGSRCGTPAESARRSRAGGSLPVAASAPRPDAADAWPLPRLRRS